jgi:hypothetical protein
VYRTSSDGWHEIGLRSAGKLLTAGQVMSNPVAAMPSLHSAFAMCVVAFFFTQVRRRWIPLLLVYPLAMSITLAYTGEHYIVDALVGWTYVAVIYLGVARAEKWWAARQLRRAVLTAGPVPLLGSSSPPIPVQVGERSAGGDAGGARPGDEQAEQR